MAITKIHVYSTIDGMGEATQADVTAYNAWLEGQLAAEYPDAEVEVIDAPSLHAVQVWEDGELAWRDGEPTDSVALFVQRCWDTCPWDF